MLRLTLVQHQLVASPEARLEELRRADALLGQESERAAIDRDSE